MSFMRILTFYLSMATVSEICTYWTSAMCTCVVHIVISICPYFTTIFIVQASLLWKFCSYVLFLLPIFCLMLILYFMEIGLVRIGGFWSLCWRKLGIKNCREFNVQLLRCGVNWNSWAGQYAWVYLSIYSNGVLSQVNGLKYQYCGSPHP